MKRLLSLLLALVCILSLCSCASGAGIPAEGDGYVYVDYPEAELYPGSDITLSVTALHPEDGTLELRVENASGHELQYGHPVFTITRQTTGGWQQNFPDYDIPAVLHIMPPGDSLEKSCSALRDVDALVSGETYRACFEFFYYTENPEADDGGKLSDIMHSYYLVQDFTVD